MTKETLIAKEPTKRFMGLVARCAVSFVILSSPAACTKAEEPKQLKIQSGTSFYPEIPLGSNASLKPCDVTPKAHTVDIAGLDTRRVMSFNLVYYGVDPQKIFGPDSQCYNDPDRLAWSLQLAEFALSS